MLAEKTWCVVSIPVQVLRSGFCAGTLILPFQPWLTICSWSSLCARGHCQAETGFRPIGCSEVKL